MDRVLAFLDTTVLSMDSSLQSAKWDSLRRAVADRQLALAVSEVTIAELSRQVAEEVEKYNRLLREHKRKLGVHLPDFPSHRSVDWSMFEKELRSRLQCAGVQVLALPRVSHEELLGREIQGRRPFKRNGTGYRDALIWHSFVEWLEHGVQGEERIFFVSANSADFPDSSGRPDRDLQADLPGELDARVVRSIQDVVEAVRPPADWLGVGEPVAVSNASEAALHLFKTYRMFTVEDLPIEEPYVSMPEFDHGVIVDLDADGGNVELNLVDKVGDVQIWDVIADVRVGIHADLWGDPHDIPEGWRLLTEQALVNRRPRVEGIFDGTWVADVRIDGDGRAIDAAVSRITLRLPSVLG